MPHLVELKNQVIRLSIEGDVGTDELIQILGELNSFEKEQAFNRIWDFRKMKSFAWHFLEMNAHNRITRGAEKQVGTHSSILVGNAEQFGIGRIIMALGEELGIQVHVTYDEAEALAWVGLETLQGNASASSGIDRP